MNVRPFIPAKKAYSKPVAIAIPLDGFADMDCPYITCGRGYADEDCTDEDKDKGC